MNFSLLNHHWESLYYRAIDVGRHLVYYGWIPMILLIGIICSSLS
jgi:hypothetical protein